MKRVLSYLCFVLLLIGCFILFDLKCPVRALFGIPCPACGMTRAWMSVFQLDFKSAFDYHPLFLLGPVLILMVIFYDEFDVRYKDILCVLLGVLFFGCYVLRLI